MRNIRVVATAVALLACGSAAAAAMTKEEYRAGKARVAADYEADRHKCGPRRGNATDVCVARARGAQKVAKAELEAAYKPSPRTNYAAAMARAQAAYGIAKEKCDYKEGEERKGCMKDARAAQDQAKAEAAAARKASSVAEPAGAAR